MIGKQARAGARLGAKDRTINRDPHGLDSLLFGWQGVVGKAGLQKTLSAGSFGHHQLRGADVSPPIFRLKHLPDFDVNPFFTSKFAKSEKWKIRLAKIKYDIFEEGVLCVFLISIRGFDFLIICILAV